MRLKEIKKLVDEWTAAGDWDEAEVMLFDRGGNHFPSGFELGFECLPDACDGRDALVITEL